MKPLIAFACLVTACSLASGTALAENIKGRMGVTGKIGLLIPADNRAEYGFRTNHTDAGLIGGGGLIYGIDNNWAGEFDITHSAFDSDTGDFGLTDFSFGAQYRFRIPESKPLVPYVGGGLDVLVGYYDPYDGSSRDVDTTLGIHLKGGVDYFLTRDLALTGEAKLVLAPDADIRDGGYRSGDFDPSSFSSAVGVRYFFK